MVSQHNSFHKDLFYEELIQPYVENSRFVERHWLAERIETAFLDPNSRFLLLTAEPGAGKTAFMAWLASIHQNWLRYFIRRDQISLSYSGSPSAHSFLLQIGFQLATIYPSIFSRENIEITIKQRIGTLIKDEELVGIEVNRLIANPFINAAIQISQEVERGKGSIIGLRINEFITNSRLIPIDDLQYMALIDPCVRLLHEKPNEKIVILIDALDELRYQDTKDLLNWLINFQIPDNVCILITSRPDDELLRMLVNKHNSSLKRITIEAKEQNVRNDLSKYVSKLAKQKEVKSILKLTGQSIDDFILLAVDRANGNFSYLDAIGRAVDQSINRKNIIDLRRALDISQMPNTLRGLYAYFLHQIKYNVDNYNIEVEDIETGQKRHLKAWQYLYIPILGILSVAKEPLMHLQIQQFGDLHANERDIIEALTHLRQFLNVENKRYRLFHSTLPEFLTDIITQNESENRDLYVDATEWHRKIALFYNCGKESWRESSLEAIDAYGFSHLTTHLIFARWDAKLHSLLLKERISNEQSENVWYTIKESRGDIGGYLDDILKAWSISEEKYNFQQSAGCLGLQCRYALIVASINSHTANIPPNLLVALVKKGIWTTDQGLLYARKIPVPMQCIEAFVLLIPKLSKLQKRNVMEAAVYAARQIQNEDERAEALFKIIPELPEPYKSEVLKEAKKTLNIAKDYALPLNLMRIFAKISLKRHDPLKNMYLKEVLDIERGTFSIYQRTTGMAIIAPQLPEYMIKEVFKELKEISHEYGNTRYTNELFEIIVPRLPKILLVEAVYLAKEIQDKYYRAKVLALISHELTAPLKDEILKEVLDVARKIQNRSQKVELLVEIAPELSGSFQNKIIEEALDATRRIRNKYQKAKLLLEISRLSKPQKNDLIRDALKIIHKIENIEEKTLALIEIAPKLPRSLQPCILKEALDLGMDIEYPEGWVEPLVNISKKLPENLKNEILMELLNLIIKIKDNNDRIRSLNKVAPELPKWLLIRALDASRQIKDENEQIMLLAKIAFKLPKAQNGLIKDVLNASKMIQDKYQRVELLLKISSESSHSFKNEIIMEALNAARMIQNDSQRAKLLLKIAYKLSDFPKNELIEEALIAAKMIQDKFEMINLLVEIASESSDSLKNEIIMEALDSARMIQDKYLRAKLLDIIASELSDSLKNEILIEALNGAKDSNSKKLLMEIAAKLPEPLNYKRLKEILEFVRKTHGELQWEELLMEMAPKLPDSLKQEILKDIMEYVRSNKSGLSYEKLIELIVKMAPDPPESFLREIILEAKKEIDKKGFRREEILIDLFVKLPDPLKDEMLKNLLDSIREIQSEFRQKYLLQRVVSKLSILPKNDIFEEALEASRTLDDFEQAKFIKQTASKSITSKQKEKLLNAAMQINNDPSRAYALIGIASKLSEPMKNDVFKAALEIIPHVQNSADRKILIFNIAPEFPESILLKEIRGVILGNFQVLSGQDVWEKLTEINPNLLLKELPYLLSDVNYSYAREKLMVAIEPYLSELSIESLYSIWKQILPILASRTRMDLFADITILIPVIYKLGKEEALIEIFCAVRDVKRWWH